MVIDKSKLADLQFVQTKNNERTDFHSRPRSLSLGTLYTQPQVRKPKPVFSKETLSLSKMDHHPFSQGHGTRKKDPFILCGGYQVDEKSGSEVFYRHLYKPCSCCYTRLSKYWSMYGNKILQRIRFLKLLPGLLLTVSLSVVVSNLWLNEADAFTLAITLGFIMLSVMMTFLEFHCSVDGTSACAHHFWWGLMLSLLAFGRPWYRTWLYDDRDRLADMLLMTSTALKCCCDLLDRVCKVVSYSSAFLSLNEMMTLFGYVLGAATFLVWETDVNLIIITVASAFVVTNFRMKCPLAFIFFLLFAAISGVSVFDNFGTTLNPCALICFHVRLFFPPAADFYFSPLSALERWSCSFTLGRFRQCMIILLLLAVESGFCAIAFYAVRLHPDYELVFVVPVVSISGLLWVSMHFSYLATEVLLARKLCECREFLHKLPTSACSTSLSHIMSSRGVRHICLIGQQTVACALVTSVVFGAVSWRREDAFYPALLLVVIGSECWSFGRMRELAVKLGGTCVAYALITPTTVTNANAAVTILPTGSIEKQNSRATSIIATLHRFFAIYLIENFGCDYVTNGLTLGAVEQRLQNMFGRRAKDAKTGSGARHDTYIFYFSGITGEDGALLLRDGAALTPDHVIELWRESCCDGNRLSSSRTSRLLLVLDVPTPQPWLKMVRALQRDYVAVQTCTVTSPARDVESAVGGSLPDLGRFTTEWVQWNCDVTIASAARWDCDASLVRPAYATSRRWTDFALRVPTADDDGFVANHWSVNYPGLCRPCLALSASCAVRLQLVRVLGAPGRRYRRLKMRWFPPFVLDTGHGFKLIRS